MTYRLAVCVRALEFCGFNFPADFPLFVVVVVVVASFTPHTSLCIRISLFHAKPTNKCDNNCIILVRFNAYVQGITLL